MLRYVVRALQHVLCSDKDRGGGLCVRGRDCVVSRQDDTKSGTTPHPQWHPHGRSGRRTDYRQMPGISNNPATANSILPCRPPQDKKQPESTLCKQCQPSGESTVWSHAAWPQTSIKTPATQPQLDAHALTPYSRCDVSATRWAAVATVH